MSPDSQRNLNAELLVELRRCNDLMERQIANHRNWRLAFRNGLVAGLGTILGMTVLVSILVSALKPFKKLETLGPMIDRLDQTLQERNRPR
jgi:transposase